jgi:hypothetical protein
LGIIRGKIPVFIYGQSHFLLYFFLVNDSNGYSDHHCASIHRDQHSNYDGTSLHRDQHSNSG